MDEPRAMETMTEHATAIVLCGGRSSRMGKPKAALPFGDETLLARTVRIVGEVTEEVIVVAGLDQEVPESTADRIVHDTEPFEGPLMGIAVGLEAASHDRVLVVSCDAPFLVAELLEAILAALDGFAMAIPRVEDRLQPLTCGYRASGVLGPIRKLLEEGERRPRALLERVPSRVLEEELIRTVDPELLSFVNANTPEAYRAALERQGASS